MSWWGKIAGAFFGALLGGFLGLIIGLIIGHQLDKQFSIAFRGQFQRSKPSSTPAQEIFFQTTFRVMGHIAKADGRVTEREIAAAEQVMEHLQLNPERRQQAIRYFQEGKSDQFNLYDNVKHLINSCHREPQLLRLFFDIQLKAATAEGPIPLVKQRILQTLSQMLGLPWFNWSAFSQFFEQQQYHRTGSRQQYRQPGPQQPSLSEAYADLNIPPTSTNDEIKKAYRRLMKENHPDKLIAKGLPKEMIKLATEKTQKIQKAYELLRKHRQIK